jgi:cysteinyl-tRNA synthetase
MSMSLLGSHFDIHTGGIDHRELHHVNEIAQSEAYLEDGAPWVRYWVHSEFLTFKDAKMSKSAGGTIRLADLTAMGVHPRAFRYLVLGSHYGSQLEYSDRIAQAAHVGFKRLSLRLRAALGAAAGSAALDEPITVSDAVDEARTLGSAVLEERLLALDAAIVDDLGTPRVVDLLNTWARDPGALPTAEWEVLIRAVNAVTGLAIGVLSAGDFVPPVPDDVDLAWVEDRLEEREAARAARDWPLADRLRDELGTAGIRVEDTPDGTHWFYAGPG